MPPDVHPDLSPAGPLFAMIKDMRENMQREFSDNRTTMNQVLERVTRLETSAASSTTMMGTLQTNIAELYSRVATLEKTSVPQEELVVIRSRIAEWNHTQPTGGCRAFHERVHRLEAEMASHITTTTQFDQQRKEYEKNIEKIREASVSKTFKMLQLLLPFIAVLLTWLLGNFGLNLVSPEAANRQTTQIQQPLSTPHFTPPPKQTSPGDH